MITNIYSDQWLDQVFEQRNKKYGAYILRKKADDHIIISLLIAASLIAAIFISPKLVNTYFGDNGSVKPIFDPTVFTVIDPPVIIPPVERNMPAELPQPPSRKLSDLVKPVIVKEEMQTDDNDHAELMNPDNLYTPIKGNGTPGDTTSTTGTGMVGPYIANIDTNVYRGGIEIMPQYPGGENAMLTFLSKHLKYPQSQIGNNITGTVYLSFIIDKEGKVTGIDVLRGLNESKDFENEARRVVSMMPQWKPGRQNGQNVNVCFTLPVRFSLR